MLFTAVTNWGLQTDMAAQIGQRVFATGPQEYISLKNDEYIRQMPISNAWTRIRIGVLWAIDGSVSIPGAYFAIGLCTYPYGLFSWNCPAWVGMILTDFVLAYTMTYTAGAAPYYSTQGKPAFRTGSAVVTPGTNGPYYVPSNTGTPQRRGIYILEVIKGTSGTYSVNSYGSLTAAQAALDWSYANVLEACSQFSAPTVGGTALTVGASTANNLAAYETTGIFDSVCVSWSKLNYALEIYGLAVCRLY